MAYAMDDYGVTARKAWFMFDRQVVCLGAGIKGDSLATTVNQCHLTSEVFLVSDSATTRMAPQSQYTGPFKGYVWQGKVAYYLPDESTIDLRNTTQTGNWARINFNQSTEPVSKPVFNFAITHGEKSDGDSYAYVVIPGIASPMALTHLDPKEIEIVANTPECQIVVNHRLGIAGAVFYSSGNITWNGHTFSSDIPDVKLIKI